MSFTARYAGRCADCDMPIKPGHEVTYDLHDELVHLRCPDRPDDVAMSETPCERCFCYHRGECA